MTRPRNPPPADTETHRGAFGEFGGESSAFIERTFRERILLVGVDLPPHDPEAVDASLDELALLVDTAGADVVGRIVQRRDTPDPATYVGRGKLEEIRRLAEATDCDTVVFDDELSPAQQRNLESSLGRSAIDRTAVILDIFAQNAHSQEGRAQVQLALFRYRLPRLRGKGVSLSQQAGGIGARRGPGETQFEIDRRRIERQIHKLESDLVRIGRQRKVRAKSRTRAGIPHVVIVGYTNAGKSTLLNRITTADVLVENRLFATLDATTRQLSLPGGEDILATDTVGFVSKLPHQLVEAFRTTLDVVLEADLLVHVVDGAGPDPQGNIEAVHDVIREIGGGELPELVVYNKADRSDEPARLATMNPPAVAVSAGTGDGIDRLLSAIADRLRARMPTVTLEVPWDRGDVLAAVHRGGEVLAEEPCEQHMSLTARLPEALIARHGEFAVDVPAAAETQH
ncbi:MAG: GTPase HflX [Microthrixaceae bacterium]